MIKTFSILVVLASLLIIDSFSYSDQLLSSKSKNAKYTALYQACNNYSNLGNKQQCWEDFIEKTLKREGLDSAFNVVDYLYASEPQFASDCHGFTHLLGEKAYELFSRNQKFNVSPKTSYCGFGFYHAFMESLLRITGDLKQARKFCDEVGIQSNQNELARLSCFHGIGHGLLEDIPNPIIKGNAETLIRKPLAICVKLSQTDVEIYRCASGVFNVLAIYYGNPKVGLTVNKENPYLICHNQTRRSFKEACYDQMNSFVLSLGQGNLSKAAKFTKNIQEDDLASAAIHGLAGAYGQSNVAKINYDDVVKECYDLEPRLISSCIEGFLLGMIEGGKPGEEYVEAIKFCNSRFIKEDGKTKCFSNIIWNVGTTNPDKLKNVCGSMEKKYRKNCNVN